MYNMFKNPEEHFSISSIRHAYEMHANFTEKTIKNRKATDASSFVNMTEEEMYQLAMSLIKVNADKLYQWYLNDTLPMSIYVRDMLGHSGITSHKGNVLKTNSIFMILKQDEDNGEVFISTFFPYNGRYCPPCPGPEIVWIRKA